MLIICKNALLIPSIYNIFGYLFIYSIMRLVRMIDNYINDKGFSMVYTNKGIDIVNYSEIIDFSSNRISIRYNDCIYYIYGDNLVISKMMEEEIFISGIINKIIFE